MVRVREGVWGDVAFLMQHSSGSEQMGRLHRKWPALAAHLSEVFLSYDGGYRLRDTIEARRKAAWNALRPASARNDAEANAAWKRIEEQQPEEAYQTTWEGACSMWVAEWLRNNGGGGKPMESRDDIEMVPLYGISVMSDGPVPANNGEIEMALDACPMLRDAMQRVPKVETAGDVASGSAGESKGGGIAPPSSNDDFEEAFDYVPSPPPPRG